MTLKFLIGRRLQDGSIVYNLIRATSWMEAVDTALDKGGILQSVLEL